MGNDERIQVPAMARRPVTQVLSAACVLVFVAGIVIPAVHAGLGGANSMDGRPWALLTAAFVHGFSPESAVPHLAGNLILLQLAGGRVEERLGSWRYAALTGIALVLFAGVQAVAGFEVNGASVFIWAYAPSLAYLTLRTRASGGPAVPVLLVMWIVVPLGMTGLVIHNGWDRGIGTAFLVGNTFHLSATLAGVIGLVLWRNRLQAGTVTDGRP